jgi:hypothetical protein
MAEFFKPIAPHPQLVRIYMNKPVLKAGWSWPRQQPGVIDVTFEPGTNFFYRPLPQPETNGVLDAVRVLLQDLIMAGIAPPHHLRWSDHRVSHGDGRWGYFHEEKDPESHVSLSMNRYIGTGYARE